MGKPKYPVSAIERALEILMLLFREKREMGITEIAAAMGLHKSTVHRALTTLQEYGFVEQNPVTSKYWLGIRLFSLGMLYRDKMRIQDLARPFTEELARKCREVVHMGILENQHEIGRVLVIDKVETEQILSLTPRIGSGTPAHCSAMGKMLLAYQSDEYLEKFAAQGLPRYTKNTITDLEELKRELRQIKRQGYALDREEIEVGLTCVAAPILDGQGKAVAAVSVSGPVTRITPERLPLIINDVKETAARISEQIK